MAESNIGSLPQAQTLDDDSLLVAEQQGQAVKVTGAQFKEFGRQAVITEVQGYVDQAEAAADEAVNAVSAVTDMTVEASTLASGQSATVTKSTKNGKVNLAFGLPRGEQGIQGPAGQVGPRGPQGSPGKGLTILGHYDTEAALRDAVTAPEVGDAYSVGAVVPYDTYIFDGVTLDWKNYGPLSGGGGGVIPEDVVTAEGGASITFQASFGDGPHEITMIADEEPPLTAEDVQYSATQTVKDAIDDLKSSVSDGKALVASAITDKGVPTSQDATFQQMANNIGQIPTGGDTSDATATSFDILAPKTAYTAAGKVEGVIPTLLGQTITPGTADKTIAGGQYLGGTQVIKGDPNLTSSNIKSGVTLFGVEGALESSFQATLTVTADTGAVVTATHTDGTEISALSQTGTVVLELPKEGTWSVTAVRGVAQYNTVTIQVSSSYSATLTAELHIKYFTTGTSLGAKRFNLAAASNKNYAIFAGGESGRPNSSESRAHNEVDAYDSNLTKSSFSDITLPSKATRFAGTNVGEYALFGGGFNPNYDSPSGSLEAISKVYSYDGNLIRGTCSSFIGYGRYYLAATLIGNYALFAGGRGVQSSDLYADVVAYNQNLSRISATSLVAARYGLAAASNENYALFLGGVGGNSSAVDAYDENLTRTNPATFYVSNGVAARAGNYVLAFQQYQAAAYDMFLTKTSIEVSSAISLDYYAGTTLNDFAVICGKSSRTGIYRNAIVSYDPYLVLTVTYTDANPRTELAAASIGNYALFAGGRSTAESVYTGSGLVEVYQYV